MVAGTKYLNIVNAFNAELSFWEGEIVNRDIVHFVNPYKHLAVLCRAMDVGVSILSVGRHKGYFFWANSEYCQNEMLAQSYESLSDVTPPENVKAARTLAKHSGRPPILARLTPPVPI